jgi:ABC-type phosphate transport system auxiliary subunit
MEEVSLLCSSSQCDSPKARQLRETNIELQRIIMLTGEKLYVGQEIAKARSEVDEARAAKLRLDNNLANQAESTARAEQIERQRIAIEKNQMEILRLQQSIQGSTDAEAQAPVVAKIAELSLKIKNEEAKIKQLQSKQDRQHLSIGESQLIVDALSKKPSLKFGNDNSSCALAKIAAKALGNAAYSKEYGTAGCKPLATN